MLLVRLETGRHVAETKIASDELGGGTTFYLEQLSSALSIVFAENSPALVAQYYKVCFSLRTSQEVLILCRSLLMRTRQKGKVTTDLGQVLATSTFGALTLEWQCNR